MRDETVSFLQPCRPPCLVFGFSSSPCKEVTNITMPRSGKMVFVGFANREAEGTREIQTETCW